MVVIHCIELRPQQQLQRGLLLLIAVLISTMSTVHCEDLYDCFNVTDADSDATYGLSVDDGSDGGFLTDMGTLVEAFMDSVSPKVNSLDDIGVLEMKDGDLVSISDSSSMMTSVKQIENGPAFLVCIGIGVLFIVLVPPVALIFCCCRCCNNCGGKMVQEKKGSDRLERYCCGGLLLLSSTFIVICAISILLVNADTDNIFDRISKHMNNVLDDSELYVSNTEAELNYLLDESIGCVKSSIETVINESISSMDGEIVDMINTVIDLGLVVADDVTDLYTQIIVINETASELVSDIDEITSELTVIKTGLMAALAPCDTTECVVVYNQTNALDSDFDTSDIPSSGIDSALDEVTSVYDMNYTDLLENARGNLSSEVSVKTDTIRDEIDNFMTDLDDVQIDGFNISDFVKISEINDTVNNVLDSAEQMMDSVINFKSYTLYGLASIVLVYPLFLLCGVILGLCGYNKLAEPYERNSISNCGGICLMLGTGIFLLLCSFVMMLTLIMFTVGTFSNMACNVLEEPDDIAEIFKSAMGNSTYLNILDGFSDCETNAGAYNAFSLSAYLDIDIQLSNITHTIEEEITGFTPDIDIDSDTVISGDDLNEIESFNGSSSLNINISSLSTNFSTTVDLDDYISSLESITDVNLTSYIDRLKVVKSDISDLNTLKYTLVDALSNLSTKFSDFQDNVAVLSEALTDISTTVNTTVNTEFDVSRTNLMNAIDNLTSAFSDAVHNNIGRCKPIYTIYVTTVSLVCDGIVTTVNSVMFALGASLIIGLISVFLAVHMAKHLRRMTHKYVQKGGGEDIDMQSYPQRGDDYAHGHNPNYPPQMMTPLGGGDIGGSRLNLIEETQYDPAAFNNILYTSQQDTPRNSYLAPPPPYGGYVSSYNPGE